MSVFTELARNNTRPVWLLEIDGIPERFYSGPAPTVAAVPAPYVARTGITSVSEGTAELDPIDAIVSEGSAAVTIAATRDNRAIDRLLRIGKKGASRLVTLKETIPLSAAAVDVKVHEDLAAWPQPGFFWMGQEALSYASTTLVAGTWQFDLAVRGVYGSQVQRHVADIDRGWAPRITSECVTWRGRRARLKVGSGRPGGTGPGDDYITEISGFLEASADVTDGNQIEIVIVPWLAVLDREIGGDETVTGLQHGYHAFDDAHRHWSGDAVVKYPIGRAWRSQALAGPYAAGPGPHVVTVADQNMYAAMFDPAGRPGTGSVDLGGITNGVTATAAGVPVPNGTITIPTLSRVLNTNDWIYSTAYSETFQIDLTGGAPFGGPAVVNWPGDVRDRIHAVSAPGTTQLAAGRTADLTIVGEGGNFALDVRLNSTEFSAPATLIIDWNTSNVWYPISLRSPDIPVPNNLTETRGQRDLGGWGPVEYEIPARGAAGDGALTFDIRGIVDAWWQNNELYLWLESDMGLAPTIADPQWLLVDHFEQGTAVQTHIRVADVVAASAVSPALPGFIFTVDAHSHGRSLSFGDWPEDERASVRPLVSWLAEPVTRIMLELLLSGEGTGFNHPTYDRQPYGANLSTAEVDVRSFEDFSAPVGFDAMNVRIDEATSLADLFRQWLPLMGAALRTKIDMVTGARKIALVEAGHPLETDSAKTLSHGRWAMGERPDTSNDGRLVNRLALHVNYDVYDRRFTLHIPISDRDSIDAYNREVSELEINALGLEFNDGDRDGHRAAAVPMAANVFSLYSDPRRRLHGTIAASDALALDVGSVVIVSADDAFLADASAVAAVPARVVSIRRDWDAQRVEVGLLIFPGNPAGWAPALRVTNVPNATDVDVAVNAYTAAAHPIFETVQADLDYWAVGDVARVVPTGDLAASVGALTVNAIVGQTVTLSAPHGLALGATTATVRPDSYDVSSASHRRFAFIADDNAQLGAASDDARTYS